MTAALWPWLTLAGLGAFHGINPAMGWLFAVALGLQRGERAAVLRALPPITLGHAGAIALVVVLVGLARLAVDDRVLRLAAAGCLIGFGAYRLVRGYRHKFRVGMQASFADLALWSFLMATAHGAGLMVAPVLLELAVSGGSDPRLAAVMPHELHAALMAAFGGSVWNGLLAVMVHTLAMLAVAGLIAWIVFSCVGLGILRRGWINFDLLWSTVLIGTGLGFLVLAGADLTIQN